MTGILTKTEQTCIYCHQPLRESTSSVYPFYCSDPCRTETSNALKEFFDVLGADLNREG